MPRLAIWAALCVLLLPLASCKDNHEEDLRKRLSDADNKRIVAEETAAKAKAQFEEVARRLVDCLGSADKSVSELQERLRAMEKTLNSARAERDQLAAARQTDAAAATSSVGSLRTQLTAAETRAWEAETLLLQYLGTAAYTFKDAWRRVANDMPPDVVLRALGLPTETVQDDANNVLTWSYTWQSGGQPVSGSVEFTNGKVTKVTTPPDGAFTPASPNPQNP